MCLFVGAWTDDKGICKDLERAAVEPKQYLLQKFGREYVGNLLRFSPNAVIMNSQLSTESKSNVCEVRIQISYILEIY